MEKPKNIHRKFEEGLTGVPARLIFMSGPETRTASPITPEVKSKMRDKIQEMEDKLELAEKELPKIEQIIKENLIAYNDEFENPLGIKLKEVEQALNTLRTVKESRFAEDDREDEANRQQILDQLTNAFEKYQKLIGLKKELPPKIERARAERSVENFKLLKYHEKTREWLAGKPAYTDALESFESVIGEEEFKSLNELPGKGFDTQRARENQQLFFAILQTETNDFSNDWYLGERFGRNAAENRRNFPFIYEQWKEDKGVNDSEINRLADVLNDKQQEIETKGIGSVESIIESETSTTAGAPLLETTNYWKSAQELLNKADSAAKKQIAWEKVKNAIGDFTQQYERLIAKEGTKEEDKVVYREKIKKLEIHEELAEAKFDYYFRKKEEEEISTLFVRSELEKGYKLKIMKWLMRRYQKAMNVIDRPADEKVTWSSDLHPGMRRQLIALVYRQGVSRVRENAAGVEEFHEDIEDEYRWMLTQMVKSEHFNSALKGKFYIETPAKRDFLLLAYYGNKMRLRAKAKIEEKRIAGMEKVLKEDAKLNIEAFFGETDTVEKLKNKLDWLNTDAKLKTLAFTWNNLGEGGEAKDITGPEALEIGKKMKAGLEQFGERYLKEKAALKRREEDMKKIETHLKDPTTPKAKEFLEYMRKEEEDTPYNKELMSEFTQFSKAVELNYNTADLKERSQQNVMERLGINLEGAYQVYLETIKDNPEFHVDKWNDLFNSEEGFDKLAKLLNHIIPENNSDGKKDFLAVFKTLKGENPEKWNVDAKLSAQFVAFNIYKTLQMEIQEREHIAAASDRGEEELLAKLEGQTFVDKATKYAKGVWGMAWNFNNPAKSIAGWMVILGGIKAAQAAWKGEGKAGKALRLVFGAGVAEVMMTHFTGRGFLDRTNFLDSVEQAVEGTYEAVLVQQGAEFMTERDVTEKQHTAALYALKNVPFNKVMEWYEASDENGMPRDGMRDNFPRGIDIDLILGRRATWGEENDDIEARRIVRTTVEQFFGYVGNKDEKYGTEGQKILKERWITAVNDPDFDLEKASYTEFLHSELIGKFRDNPNALTWQHVMRAEISATDVEATKDQSWGTQAWETMKETTYDFISWGREEIYGPLSANADLFFKTTGPRWAEKTKEFLVEVGKAGGRNLYFGKEHVKFQIEGNWHHIRAFGRENLELVWTGVKLPFEILYAANKFLVPLANSKIRQFKAIIQRGDFDVLKREPRNATDLFGRDYKLDDPKLFNRVKNPQFTHFGVYQPAFRKAYEEVGVGTVYETNEEDRAAGIDLMSGIGYYVGETKATDIEGYHAGISKDVLYAKLQKKSYEDAVEAFVAKGADREAVLTMMYPIHIKIGGDKENPGYIYTFYRMPMPDSIEYNLKAGMGGNRWPEYMDPNQYKHRLPFMVDSSRSFLENLKDAYVNKMPLTREAAHMLSIFMAQWFRILENAVGGLANLTHAGVKKALGESVANEMLPFIDLVNADEITKQRFDEYGGGAGHGGFALSEFWQTAENSKKYSEALDFARRTGQGEDLYLGHITGRESTSYNQLPPRYSSEAEYLAALAAWKAANERE